MDCPECHGETDVTDSRPVDGGSGIRRRRKCRACGHAFTTYELAENVRAAQYAAVKAFGTEIRAAVGRFERSQKPTRQEHRRELGPKPEKPKAAVPAIASTVAPGPAPSLAEGPPVASLRERLRARRAAS